MGEARRRVKHKELTKEDAERTTERFNSIKSFPIFDFIPGNEKLHALKGYHHLMHLIFIRAKHLRESLLEAIQNQNSYTSFVLIKAYFETTVLLCYAFIESKKLIDKKNYMALLDWAERHAMGGRYFPTEEMVKKRGRRRGEFQQDRIGKWMWTVDKDFNSSRKDKNDFELNKMYVELIAECGHPTFLGLSICEERKNNGTIPHIDKKFSPDDDSMTLNHLCLVDIYFFYYWDKFYGTKDSQLSEVS